MHSAVLRSAKGEKRKREEGKRKKGKREKGKRGKATVKIILGQYSHFKQDFRAGTQVQVARDHMRGWFVTSWHVADPIRRVFGLELGRTKLLN